MKIAVLCSGGDAPGMNAAIWRITAAAAARGWQVIGIPEGFRGLLDGRRQELHVAETMRHARHGGAWLGVARVPDLPERIDDAVAALTDFDALVVIGGNGSLAGAGAVAAGWGRSVLGLPATIDNDIAGTELSLGYDTALLFGLEVADRQRDSAEALPRLFCIETLGGPTGHLADMLGRLAGADVTLIPEDTLDETEIVARMGPAKSAGGPMLIVASEGYPELHAVLTRVCARLGTRLRMSSLGHAQRGGAPTPRDRALAIAFADRAVQAMADGRSGYTVLTSGTVGLVDLSEVGPARQPDPQAWRGVL
ncbi:MAG: 6-phosphofructokinase [Pseudomonadota bacterium]